MRLSFAIRNLLWLTLVIGLGIGWRLDRSDLRHRIEIYGQN